MVVVAVPTGDRRKTALLIAGSALLGAGLMYLLLRGAPGAGGPAQDDPERSGGVAEEESPAESAAATNDPPGQRKRMFPLPAFQEEARGEPGVRAEPKKETAEPSSARSSGEKPAAGTGLWAREPAAAEGQALLAVAPAGVISGTVRLLGATPANELIEAPNRACALLLGAGARSDDYRVQEGHLADVLVFITNPPSALTASVAEPRFRFQACRLNPKVAVASSDQQLDVASNDSTFHTVRAAVGDKVFLSHALPRKLSTRAEIRPRPQGSEPLIVTLTCALHAWERSSMVVLNHPFAATTDAAGRFRLSHLPDGKYLLAAWHPKLGRLAGPEVVVARGASAPVVLDFSVDASAELKPASP